MKLYKYRSIENQDRDLSLYSSNYFWASSKEELNDENEFTYNAGPFFEELKIYENLSKKGLGSLTSVNRVKELAEDFFSYAKSCGVFSLSKDPNESSMWSLYASKGKGYCLVFDSDRLLKTVDDVIREQRFLLPVDYRDNVPKIVANDMNDQRLILTKMLATKSQGWMREKEVRIVTDKCGRQKFLSSALTGVIFGSNTKEETQNMILSAFKDRDMKVFQRHKLEDSYDYFVEQLPSLHKERELNPASYEFTNAPAQTVDNFYVKSNISLPNDKSKSDFVKKFKNDKADRQCNIYLMDSDTDLSKFNDYATIDQNYVERHLLAIMSFESGVVYIV